MGCSLASPEDIAKCVVLAQAAIRLFQDALEVGFFIVVAFFLRVLKRKNQEITELRHQLLLLTELTKGVKLSNPIANVKKLILNWSNGDCSKHPGYLTKKFANAKKFASVPPDEEIMALFDLTVFGSAKLCLVIGTKGLYWPGPNFIAWRDLPSAEIKDVSEGISIAGRIVPAMANKIACISMLVGLQKEVQPFYDGSKVKESLIALRALARA